MAAEEESRWSLSMILAPLRAKPWLGLVFLGLQVAGIGMGLWAFPVQWGFGLRLLFGSLLGLGAMLSLYLPRMIATDFDD